MQEIITNKNTHALRIQCNKIKELLVNLAKEDKLPNDLNDLPWTVLAPSIVEIVNGLLSVCEDANLALSNNWDRSNIGFESQVELIESVLYS